MDPSQHWETVYRTKSVDRVSWFQPRAETSLAIIQATGLGSDARVIDVGGGASVLVDDLLDAGYHRLTVMDLSATALGVSRARLGERAAGVTWRVGDITQIALPPADYDVWHDRAVFHFLTDDADRRRYVEQVRKAVRPGGYVIVATFGPNGPLRCSDLEVCRYAPETLHGEFGHAFELIGHRSELHATPAGGTQEFVYCYCRVGG